MRVVLDTNILVSGIAYPHGAPGRIVSAWLAGQFDLVLSEALLDEFSRVLRYPKLVRVMRKAGVSEEDLTEYLDLFRIKAIVVAPQAVELAVRPRDPKDVPVLEAFFASGAEFLVTGDRRDLLVMGVPGMLPAAEFISRLESFQARQEEAVPASPSERGTGGKREPPKQRTPP